MVPSIFGGVPTDFYLASQLNTLLTKNRNNKLLTSAISWLRVVVVMEKEGKEIARANHYQIY
jgi:hypothetical protein